MLAFALVIFVSSVIGIAICLIIYARWNHGVMEKMGIPVVEHHPLLGSGPVVHQVAGGPQDVEWFKKYGPIFGVYEGREPQIFICDADLVRQILIVDADSFNSKRQMTFGDPILDEMPDFLFPVEKWRMNRHIVSPAFSSAKVKLMNLPMREAVVDFIDEIKETIHKSGGTVEKMALDLSLHTMLTDLISRCVFSIKINGANDNNRFANLVKEIMKPETEQNNHNMMYWSYVFPFLRKFLNLTIFSPEPAKEFVTVFKQLLDERRESGIQKNDVVDMCLEWYDRLNTPEFKDAQITEYTVMCNALMFFFFGQDQLSNTIAITVYKLLENKNAYESALKEIDAAFEKHGGKLEHEHLNELTFLNACINESLRLYPLFHRTERVCTKDWTNKKHGLNIKKGMTIQIPFWAVNRNEEFIENPEKFDPDRWLPENKHKLNVFASTAFGHGPRSCIGKRFANEILTLITAYLLKEFKFSRSKDTELTFTQGGIFFTYHEPIYMDVEERLCNAPSC